MTKKGVQDFVLETIRSIEQIPGKDYIKRMEIVEEVKKYMPEIENPYAQVGQALHHLSGDVWKKRPDLKPKYRRKRIKKIYNEKGVFKGWAVVVEKVPDYLEV